MPKTTRVSGIIPPISEAEFTRQVLQLAKLHGWRSAHFRPAQTKSGRWITAVQGDGKGFPDLILIRGTQCLAVELKVGKNKPTGEQLAWLGAFRGAGVLSMVWRPERWTEIEIILEGAEIQYVASDTPGAPPDA